VDGNITEKAMCRSVVFDNNENWQI